MSKSKYWIKIGVLKRTRRWLQCSLATLILLSLLGGLGLGLIGRHFANQQDAEYFIQAYYVADLLPGFKSRPRSTATLAEHAKNMDPIVVGLKSNVARGTWEEDGGKGCIEIFPTNQSLVIRQTKDGHSAVAEYLKKLLPVATPSSKVNSRGS